MQGGDDLGALGFADADYRFAAFVQVQQLERFVPECFADRLRKLCSECVAAFSATDLRADLARFDVPTLVIHGDDDQVVPFDVGGKLSAALIKDAVLNIYCGAPHGITDTHKEQLGAICSRS